MRLKIISTLTFLAALAVAPVLAQDATTADENFPTSQALQDEANGVVARHGDWQVRCAPEGNNCRMFQAGFDEEGNEIANISLQPLPEGSAAQLGVSVVTPLLTLLPRGVTMGVDDGVPAAYPYSWCDRAGCYARFGMTSGQVDAMKAGNSAYLSLFAITDQNKEIRAAISLTGFTDAFDDVMAR
ncbi:MAG: invasion associated locus B family protein [Rhodobacteraceae bacterium]|nr:invasion associated locus B family protein [Paracoccaceae bacterium]